MTARVTPSCSPINHGQKAADKPARSENVTQVRSSSDHRHAQPAHVERDRASSPGARATNR